MWAIGELPSSYPVSLSLDQGQRADAELLPCSWDRSCSQVSAHASP